MVEMFFWNTLLQSHARKKLDPSISVWVLFLGWFVKKHKAYKFRLYPNDKQKEYFAKCFGSVRFLYNKMLEERIELYKKYKDDKEELKRHKPKSYTQYKQEYPWLMTL